MHTYIFPRVWTDYTSGFAISRASSKEDAIQMLLKEFDRVEMSQKLCAQRRSSENILASRTGTGTYTKRQFEEDLRSACAVMNDVVPFAFFVGGGS